MVSASGFITLLSLVSAAAAGPASYSYSSRCYTKQGSSPVRSWSTYWSTSTTACTSTSTVVATSTSTPAATTLTSTSTATATTTIVSSSTATATFTSVVPTTVTTSQTVTLITSTTVQSTSTSTVASPAGFVPIMSSLPGSTYDGQFGAVQQRDVAIKDAPVELEARDYSNKRPFGSRQYPQAVSCYAYTNSKCSTVSTTSTSIVAAPTPTSSTSVTVTTTTTTYSSASTTVSTTITSTSTATATTTVTTTSTQTSTQVSVATLFAACASNNIADLFNGVPGDGYGGYSGQDTDNPTTNAVSASSAYDCCVAAYNDPNYPGAWAYSAGTCYIYELTSQATSQTANKFSALVGNQYPGGAFGNGRLGEFTSTTSDTA